MNIGLGLRNSRVAHQAAPNPYRLNERFAKQLDITCVDMHVNQLGDRCRFIALNIRRPRFFVEVVDVVLQRINCKIADNMPKPISQSCNNSYPERSTLGR